MCGIAGYFGFERLTIDRIERCLGLMDKRGPDHSAHQHYRSGGRNIHLLHTRLSIIDLDSRSNQPFQYASMSMIFNGELYNYLELKKELTGRGHVFVTESDTEVLLHTLADLGWQGLDRCEGMWAFAVYDEGDGSLLLCRDRFGEKPLYLYQHLSDRHPSGWYFGSEVKFIAALLGRKLDINVDHLYRYLVNGYKSLYKTRHTFFKGLSELPPATTLRLNGSICEGPRSYWKPVFEPDDSLTYQQAVAGAREHLIRSVELRLRADVPLAFCMSGGIDSNSLIGIAKNIFQYDVHGFTITNTDSRYEEQDMVDRAVKEFGIRHTAVSLQTDDFLPKLRMLVRQHDAPIYTITYFAHWLLMKRISELGYRISLSGTGADEMFSGYYDHHLAYLWEIRHDAALHQTSRTAWLNHIQPIVRNPFLRDPEAFIKNPGSREHIFLHAEEFESYLTGQWHESFAEAQFTGSLLRNRMLNEMFHEAVPVILHEDDLNAMYFSIENRSPYLDRDLFEFCYTIPSKYLIRGGFAKAILRDAMKGIVPAAILSNPRKVGFNAPILSLLNVHDPKVRSYLLDGSSIFEHVRHDKIENLIAKRDLPNSESKFLFYFLTSKIFLEEFAA